MFLTLEEVFYTHGALLVLSVLLAYMLVKRDRLIDVLSDTEMQILDFVGLIFFLMVDQIQQNTDFNFC